MSSLSQFVGGNTPAKVIVNRCSAGGVIDGVSNLSSNAQNYGFAYAISGALVANTLATVLSLTGRGQVDILVIGGLSGTNTHRCKVTIDGTVVFDATSSANVTNTTGMNIVGTAIAGISNPIYFNKSFLVEYATSFGATGATGFGYSYRTY